MINADVSVDVKHAGSIRIGIEPVSGQSLRPFNHGSVIMTDRRQFSPQSLHFGNSIQSKQFSQLSGRLESQSLHHWNSEERHEREQGENVDDVVISGVEIDLIGEVGVKSVFGKSRQGAKHPSVFHIVDILELAGGAVQFT